MIKKINQTLYLAGCISLWQACMKLQTKSDSKTYSPYTTRPYYYTLSTQNSESLILYIDMVDCPIHSPTRLGQKDLSQVGIEDIALVELDDTTETYLDRPATSSLAALAGQITAMQTPQNKCINYTQYIAIGAFIIGSLGMIWIFLYPWFTN